MQLSDDPGKIPTPWADGGVRNVVPVGSLIGITDGAASFTDGFPPLTMTDPGAGGLFPDGKDFNGAFFALSAAIRWGHAGGRPTFDSAFSTAVGGYPIGAVLQAVDQSGFWISTANNNTTDPDAGGANWTPLLFVGSIGQALGSSNITLTKLQAAKPIIVLTGVLSANVNLILPAWVKQWLVVNNTTGAFVVSAKTAAGTAAPLQVGSNYLWGDGTNILNTAVVTTQSFTSAQLLASDGYQKFPGGLILQWGSFTFADVPSGTPGITGSVTFSATGIAFPSACVWVGPSFQVASGGAAINNVQFALAGAPSATSFSYQIQEWSAATNPGTLRWAALGF